MWKITAAMPQGPCDGLNERTHVMCLGKLYECYLLLLFLNNHVIVEMYLKSPGLLIHSILICLFKSVSSQFFSMERMRI